MDVSLAFYRHYIYDVGMEDRTQEVQPVLTKQPLSWSAHEYMHIEKNSEWFWALGLIGVAGAVAALTYGNILFSIVILLAAFVLALFAARKPEEFTFTLTQRGVRINDTLHPYQTLKSFSIEDISEKHISKLVLETKKTLSLDIIIPLTNVDLEAVHDFLYDYLPEEDHEEPLANKIMEWFGF